MNKTEQNQADQFPRYLTMKQAAQFANVAENTLRKWVYAEGLPAVRRGRVVRIEKAALIQWLEPNVIPAKAVA